jgi:ATP-dependent Lon protease
MQKPSIEGKITISRDFVIPRCIRNVGLCIDSITFDDATLTHIVSKNLEEPGLRSLGRHIEGCIRKINLILMLGEKEAIKSVSAIKSLDKKKREIEEVVKDIILSFKKKKPIKVSTRMFDLISIPDQQANSGPPVGMYM